MARPRGEVSPTRTSRPHRTQGRAARARQAVSVALVWASTVLWAAGCTEVALTAFGEPGEFCSDTVECLPGLVCADEACTPEDPAGLGDACPGEGWCEVGLVCASGLCQAPGGGGVVDAEDVRDVAGELDVPGDLPDTPDDGDGDGDGAADDGGAPPDDGQPSPDDGQPSPDDGQPSPDGGEPPRGDGGAARDDGGEPLDDGAALDAGEVGDEGPDLPDPDLPGPGEVDGDDVPDGPGPDTDEGAVPDGQDTAGDAGDGDTAQDADAGPPAPGVGDPCDGDCPAGLVCMPQGDGTNACEPFALGVCLACESSTDCALPGADCLEFPDGAKHCGAPCAGNSGCPNGFFCQEGQCWPETLSCACTQALEGFTMPCQNVSADGTCNGVILCVDDAWTTCSATPPVPEVCDGKDNDCDGIADEEPFYIEQGQALVFGSICGIGQCEGGEVVCAPDGSTTCSTNGFATPELCNDNVDNDCDGQVNEDCESDDFDGDGLLNDEDCAPFDSAIYQGALEPCCPAGAPTDQCDLNCDGATTACAACDIDGDGFCPPEDCAEGDETRYPGAPEKCDDGVDQDCVGGDLLCGPGLDLDNDDYAAPADCNDSNPTVKPGAFEVCDNLDNDCDGITDEGNAGGGAPCGTTAQYCQAGQFVCTHYGYGAIVECQGEVLFGAEVCDGIDNDCNGVTDDAFPKLGTPCDGPDQDACPNGVFVCKGDGSGTFCDAETVENLVEVCNDVDDDCDGATDEFVCSLDDLDADGVTAPEGDCDDYRPEVYPGAPEPCCDPALGPAGQTLCDLNCDGVVLPCNAFNDVDADGFSAAAGDCDDDDPQAYPGAPEKCGDGIDQDCVGGDQLCATIQDNDFDGFAADVDCNDFATSVNPWALETCNFIDDDCDGVIDDGNPSGKTGPCGPEVPECAPGTWVCAHDPKTYTVQVLCVNDSFQAPEACNGLDDDCDGEVDETYFDLGEPCDGPDGDQCAFGERVCNAEGDGTVCGAEFPSGIVELCDAIDNDCNGLTDDGIAYDGEPLGGPCDGMGECGPGVVVCSLFLEPTCSTNADGPFSQATVESCDGQDDDCDGLTDEDFLVAEVPVGGPCDGVGECGDGLVECAGATSATCSTDADGSASEASGELCNGLDDDCDGTTDEGVDPKTSSCDKGGVCGEDLTIASCVEGEWACDYALNPDWQEVEDRCDGLDNDCDGITDEGWPLGQPCDGPDSDQCTNGVRICSEAGDNTVCGPETVEGLEESCNGLDDDCDGDTDELTFDPVDVGCSVEGVCALLTSIVVQCGEAGIVCDYSGIAGYQDTETWCDGVDNDCDGVTDEDQTVQGIGVGGPCEGQGACSQGTVECHPFNKQPICSTEPPGSDDQATDELCDGLDNDCDGETDEGFQWFPPTFDAVYPLGTMCDSGGGCGMGFVECLPDGSGAVCSTAPGGSADASAPESCNGIDDDCDASTDEEYELDPADAGCIALGVCGSTELPIECQFGAWSCQYGALAAYEPDETLCDDVDNDCDGQTDENQPFKGLPCDGPDADQCATGSWTCLDNGKGLQCVNETGAAAEEVCDGLDNDCDGITDDGQLYNGVPLAQPCVGTGACGVGTIECGPELTAVCSTNPDGSAYDGSPEVCNGVDDDCDGETDEGLTWDGIAVGEACDGTGVCGPGVVVCSPVDGKPTCSTNPDGTAPEGGVEDCDGLDNDCNGETDEFFSQFGQNCDVEDDDDFCKTGLLVCKAGAPTCFGDVPCVFGASCVDPGPGAPQFCSCQGPQCSIEQGDTCGPSGCQCNGGPACTGSQTCTPGVGCE